MLVPLPRRAATARAAADSFRRAQCGEDKHGRPIIYSCFGMASERSNGAGNVEHMSGVLDRAIATMSPHVDSYIWARRPIPPHPPPPPRPQGTRARPHG